MTTVFKTFYCYIITCIISVDVYRTVARCIGVLGLIWYVFWLWLCFEKPSLHPTISAKELNYIESSLGAATQSAAPTIVNTPWKAFFTSMPVYAIIVANFCRSWNFYLLVLFQASYLHSFNFEVSAVSYAHIIWDLYHVIAYNTRYNMYVILFHLWQTPIFAPKIIKCAN